MRALVLAGAPIDIAAERSALGDISAATPREAVDELLNLGDGLLLGRLMLAMWPLAEPTPAGVREILQMDNDADGDATEALVRRFMKWHRTVSICRVCSIGRRSTGFFARTGLRAAGFERSART